MMLKHIKQNRCRKQGVLPTFQSKPELFKKYKNILVLMILNVRKDFMVYKQRDLLWSDSL